MMGITMSASKREREKDVEEDALSSNANGSSVARHSDTTTTNTGTFIPFRRSDDDPSHPTTKNDETILYDDLCSRKGPLASLPSVPSKRRRQRCHPPSHQPKRSTESSNPATMASPFTFNNNNNDTTRRRKRPLQSDDDEDSEEDEATSTASEPTDPRFAWHESLEQPAKTPIYAVAWSDPVHSNDGSVCLAAVSGRNVTLYRVPPPMPPEQADESDRLTSLLHCYVDAHPQEDYYATAFCGQSSLASTQDAPNALQQLLCVGGKLGLIHIIDCIQQQEIRTLSGHGDEIFDLQCCPGPTNHGGWLLLSASKDHTCRLWNLRAPHPSPVAIFGGHDGHGAAVNRIAWHAAGRHFVSGGMDNTVKVWALTDAVDAARASSERFTEQVKEMKERRALDLCEWKGTVLVQFPIFSSKKIHVHCVDCVEFLGDLVLSKSTENVVRLWLPQVLGRGGGAPSSLLRSPPSSEMILLRTFVYEDADLWFVRFGLEPRQKLLAVGTMLGTIYLWNIATSSTPFQTLRLPRAAVIRYVSFSPDGTSLVATTDQGVLHRWTIHDARSAPKCDEGDADAPSDVVLS